MRYSTCTGAVTPCTIAPPAVVNAAGALTGPAGAPGGKHLQKYCNIL